MIGFNYVLLCKYCSRGEKNSTQRLEAILYEFDLFQATIWILGCLGFLSGRLASGCIVILAHNAQSRYPYGNSEQMFASSCACLQN